MNTGSTFRARDAGAGTARSLSEILVPTDLEDPSDDALAHAALLAQSFGSRVTLYHALEFADHEEPHWAFSERASVWAEEERLARDYLASSTEGLKVPHREVVERSASPLRALLHRIEVTAPDLTVMATRSRGPLEHALVGSTTERVVGACRTPVLCARGSAPPDRQLAGPIVLPTDFSPGDRAALEMAGLLASAFGGELVVACTRTRRTPGSWSAHAPEPPWRPFAEAERWLQPVSRERTVRVVMAAAASLGGVLDIARREHAGLLVIPRRGRAGRWPAYSPAARVVRHARCSVLVV